VSLARDTSIHDVLDLGLTDAYRYDLPAERIAKAPVEPRDSSRLLVLRPDCAVEHRAFTDFPSVLEPGDVLVVNETRVIRARLRGSRERGGAAEVLLLRPSDHARYHPEARRWYALVRPGSRLKVGASVRFDDDAMCRIIGVAPDGVREVELDLRVPLESLLERRGEMPLPPYVGAGDEARAARYQTVFARVPGSVAAPTASLHFTERVFDEIRARGVTIVPLVLDVGLATFRPIESERVADHVMHGERYMIPPSTAEAINEAKAEGRRVVAAGTTVVRALEGSAVDDGLVHAGEAETNLFITPGFTFRVVDALLTNFHLPASTLLVLVCAFAGHDNVLRAYGEAIEAGYRFYSFGDAMFVRRGSQVPLGGDFR
jgi:S-adenosylmethionine:tRNA ribosyltransferase-isomerase